jgi:sterol desaturase/sphingolipid hydroxylase (fatty acid hydroxylase superfamily)
MTDATTLHPAGSADKTEPRQTAKLPFLLQWLTWPIALIGGVGAVILAPRYGMDMVSASGAVTGIVILTLVVMERFWPADRKWAMTWRSFGRDIQFFVINGATIFLTNLAFAFIGIEASQGHTGPLTATSLWLGVPVAVLVIEFFQYWQHRISHEASGPLGRLMWRSHAAHHLPEQVYVLMHPAGHPLTTFFVRGFVTILPVYLLGLPPTGIVIALLVMGIQGIISHSNLDLRAGWFNYIFVGAELHRYHHSADLKEAGNYATALSILDILFGTFVYRPGEMPVEVGISGPDVYPRSGQVARIMLLPFRPLRRAPPQHIES